MVMKQASSALLRPRISRSCDQCKARKVRCIYEPDSRSCKSCLRRNTQCHFSQTKRKLRPSEQGTSPGQVSSTPLTDISPEKSRPWDRTRRKLYVDHLLENPRVGGRQSRSGSIFKAHENYVASSNLAFFSESRIRSLTERLGNDKLRGVVEGIDSAINARLNPTNRTSSWMIQFRRPSSPVHVSKEAVFSYIQAYFDHVHPTYPFLDRNDFEKKAFGPDLCRYLEACPPFSALYHTVLALGCQYFEGGSFDPGKGKEWKLFQVSLGLFLDILVPREALVNVQAITAMSIFALNLSCLQIGETLMSEAARMAQSLGYHRALYAGECEMSCQRTFWVVYSLEKTASFFIGKSSAFLDSDVGCPIPETPLPELGGFDWFLSFARYGRLISKTYDMLFSVTATMNSTDQYFRAIDEIYNDLENWRTSFPEEFRPGGPFRPQNFPSSYYMLMSLRWHYYYYGVLMSLCRLTLHIGANTQCQRLEVAIFRLMNAARVVIDLTRFINTEPYTSIWMLGIIPLSALFILFDFVIHNPFHPETSTNLALLGVAVGHFSRLDYASAGSLPCSMLSDFAHLAQQFVRDARSESDKSSSTAGMPSNDNNTMNNYNNAFIGNSGKGQRNSSAVIPTDVGHLTGHVTNQQMPIANQMNNNGYGVSVTDSHPIPVTENLLYPVTEFPDTVYGDILACFDISNLFDAVLPDPSHSL